VFQETDFELSSVEPASIKEVSLNLSKGRVDHVTLANCAVRRSPASCARITSTLSCWNFSLLQTIKAIEDKNAFEIECGFISQYTVRPQQSLQFLKL
jgi:hypothetical protein